MKEYQHVCGFSDITSSQQQQESDAADETTEIFSVEGPAEMVLNRFQLSYTYMHMYPSIRNAQTHLQKSPFLRDIRYRTQQGRRWI